MSRDYGTLFTEDVVGNSSFRAVLTSGSWPADGAISIPSVTLNNMVG